MESSFIISRPGLEVIKLFSCSTQLSMKFLPLIKLKCYKIKIFLAFKLSYVEIIMLINVKMFKKIGILTYMSIIHFALINVKM